MKAITKLYGWTDELDEGAGVDLHAPYPTWEELAQAVVTYYNLSPEEEVDVIAGAVRPMRVWEFGWPSLDAVLKEMRGAPVPIAVSREAFRDRQVSLTVAGNMTAEVAEYHLQWAVRKWAERCLRAHGWWLTDPRTVTVGGDGVITEGAIR